MYKPQFPSVFRQCLHVFCTVLVCLFPFAECAFAEQAFEEKALEQKQHYAPYTDFPRQVFWGDTHLHTNLSMDAYNLGNRKLGPDAAYRFAKGETVVASGGRPARINRPLDFLVIADHASNMGVMQGLENKNSALLNSTRGQRWAAKLAAILSAKNINDLDPSTWSYELFQEGFLAGKVGDETFQRSVWQAATALADTYNDPGHFTAFIGYEWTQMFYNLHRVVIYKDGADKASTQLPFTQYDSSDPEQLWAAMDRYQAATGGEVLAIPHNGNFSRGVMFALEDVSGNALSVSYAKTRSRLEPLVEVTQIKGDSEAHPALSPLDPFADFDTVAVAAPSKGDWADSIKQQRGLTHYDSWINQHLNGKDNEWMHRYGYARPALKMGLKEQARIGINPFKFGMIGSTDSHTSLASAEENNFWGKVSWVEPNPQRVVGTLFPNISKAQNQGFAAKASNMSAAGYAAVWAEENTRESLFAAMKRKEVYASTGPRMTVRFFGGWDFQQDDAFSANLPEIGYRKGVPMGGDLSGAPAEKSPSFLIRAVKDPDGANLDRVQVIKGWLDDRGELRERVYNVAVSEQSRVRADGTVVAVGNTIDIESATYLNTIGSPELAVVWQDPEFRRNQHAFYYARVLEIPTPRWTAFDAKYFGLKELPEEIPRILQERTYTSPIWYSPPDKVARE